MLASPLTSVCVPCCLQLGLNVMADLTNDEYKQRFLGTRVPEERLNRTSTAVDANAEFELERIPKKVDWREHNAVTEVKNQETVGDLGAVLVYVRETVVHIPTVLIS